ncbi:MAG TPA: T9SS type A sorting domain-containing protein, partial [Membranihabitans sp.]|nr:T9SS type A sorting domain-containing protein [Membranihabitans sp.]
PNPLTGKIKVFPNPASQYITIQARPELAIQRIRILDIQGKELYRHVSGSDTHDITVSTSSWSPGPVFISITTDHDVWTEKIIILP